MPVDIKQEIQVPGQGSYPRYHGLWHLEALGVVTDTNTFERAAWDLIETEGASRPVRVALIDTSVDFRHPNLTEALNRELAVDFVSNPRGAFVFPQDGGPDRAALLAALAAAAGAGQGKIIDARVAALHTALTADRTAGKIAPVTATAPIGSSHGTSMAGIIGARPVEINVHVPQHLPNRPGGLDAQDTSSEQIALPYAGVNPYCEIVPISISADPRPGEVFLAMIFADMAGADLIVMATDLPKERELDTDPPLPTFPAPANRRPPASTLTANANDDERDGLAAVWEAFEIYLEELSLRRPVICAAGNDGTGNLAYPAALHRPRTQDRPGNGIFAIGARTANGTRAAYSPGSADAPVTAFALSGDGEQRDRALLRLDPFRPRAGHDTQARLFAQAEAEFLAVQSILAPDVPGRFGETDSRFLDPSRPFELPDECGSGSAEPVFFDPASLFASFSGTSAAAAIAGGMLSLVMATGGVARPGRDFDVEAARDALTGGVAFDAAKAQPAVLWRDTL